MRVQTKKGSFIEACVNTAIGFLISLIANPLFCWLFHVKMNAFQMTGYVAAFTVLSVIRGYVIRRWFNQSVEDAVNKWLKKIPDTHQSLQPEINELSKPLNCGGYQPMHDVTNKIPPGHKRSNKATIIISDVEAKDIPNDAVLINADDDEKTIQAKILLAFNKSQHKVNVASFIITDDPDPRVDDELRRKQQNYFNEMMQSPLICIDHRSTMYSQDIKEFQDEWRKQQKEIDAWHDLMATEHSVKQSGNDNPYKSGYEDFHNGNVIDLTSKLHPDYIKGYQDAEEAVNYPEANTNDYFGGENHKSYKDRQKIFDDNNKKNETNKKSE